MIRLYEYQNPDWGFVFKKFSKALFQYGDFSRADSIKNSDIQFVHVVGLGEIPIAESCKNLFIWQHCYKTAGSYDWQSLWSKAKGVFSVYNLPTENLIRLPLGYEESIYKDIIPYHDRKDTAFVTGHVIETENIDKIWLACKNADYTLFHTGEDFSKYFPTNYIHLPYMSEDVLSKLLSSCKVVFGLRALEGFEQHVLEGIACGANGVVPTLLSYDWYENLCFRVNLDENLEYALTDLLNRARYYKFPVNKELLSQYTWKSVINQLVSVILERI